LLYWYVHKTSKLRKKPLALRESIQLAKTRVISSFIGVILAFMNLDLYFDWVGIRTQKPNEMDLDLENTA
jgi:hypothetical protein